MRYHIFCEGDANSSYQWATITSYFILYLYNRIGYSVLVFVLFAKQLFSFFASHVSESRIKFSLSPKLTKTVWNFAGIKVASANLYSIFAFTGNVYTKKKHVKYTNQYQHFPLPCYKGITPRCTTQLTVKMFEKLFYTCTFTVIMSL